MVEKNTPKYKLEKIRELLSEGNYNITDTAIETAFDDFELEEHEIVEEIKTLKKENFYKSMKSQKQSGWQDVYRKIIKGTFDFPPHVSINTRAIIEKILISDP